MVRVFLALILIPLTSAMPALGTTWYVEADGSGDYPTIQAAADAAEDGDVIQLGAGRFNDYIVDPQWGNFRLWLYGDKSLTIRGAGPEQTIIGPEQPGAAYWDWGFYSDPGPASIRVESIRFENLDRVGMYFLCDQAIVSNCVFERCYDGCAFTNVGIVKVWDCTYQNGLGAIGIGLYCRSASVEIWGLEVRNWDIGISLNAFGNSEISVSQTVFDGMSQARGGLYLYGVSGRVFDCEFRQLFATGLGLDQYGDLVVENNVFQSNVGINGFTGAGISTEGGDSLNVTGNLFSGNDLCFNVRSHCDNLQIHNNHFLRRDHSTSYYIRTNPNWEWFDWYLNFENNYWGTTDEEEISQFILDGNDPEHGGTMFVDFLPLADGPVSTESTTLDALKALYR